MIIEFFDHPTKNTDLVREYHPEINTIFSFKNKIDDFYLRNLKESSISVELYIVKAGEGEQKGPSRHTPILGKAKLPLEHLLKDDQSFQVQEFRSEEGVSYGKLFFRMRMRKTLKHAIEMQTKLQDVLAKDYDKSKKLAYKHGLEEEKEPFKRSSKKVMTIEIN